MSERRHQFAFLTFPFGRFPNSGESRRHREESEGPVGLTVGKSVPQSPPVKGIVCELWQIQCHRKAKCCRLMHPSTAECCCEAKGMFGGPGVRGKTGPDE